MWVVGRTDGKFLPEQERAKRVFHTEKEAEYYLNSVIGFYDPDGLRRGEYYMEEEKDD